MSLDFASETLAQLEHYCLDRSGHQPPLLLVGSAGSGRSLLLESLGQKIAAAHPHAVVISLSVPRSEILAAERLRNLCHRIRTAYQLDEPLGHDLATLAETLHRMLITIPLERPLLLLTDDIDRLQQTLPQFLAWFPRGLTSAVRWVATLNVCSETVLEALALRTSTTVLIPELSESEAVNLQTGNQTVSMMAAPAHACFSRLSLAVLAREADAFPRSQWPRAAGTAEEVLADLYALLLSYWESQFGTEKIEKISQAIVTQRQGLTEADWSLTNSEESSDGGAALWEQVSWHGYVYEERWFPNYHLQTALQIRGVDSHGAHAKCAGKIQARPSLEQLVDWAWHARQSGNGVHIHAFLADPIRLANLWRLDPHEAIAIFRASIETDEESLERLKTHVPTNLRGELLARLLLSVGSRDDAFAVLRHEEHLLRQEERLIALLPNLSLQASLHELAGDHLQAAKVLEQLEELFRRTGQTRYLLSTLRRRALLAAVLGDLAGAEEKLNELGRLASTTGNERVSRMVHEERAQLAILTGERSAAREMALSLESEARRTGDLLALEASLDIQIQLLLTDHDYMAAEPLLTEVRKLCLVTGNTARLVQSLGQSALVANAVGIPEAALEYIEHKELLCRERADVAAVSQCLISEAALLVGKLDRPGDALSRAEEAGSLAEDADDDRLRAQALRLCAEINQRLELPARP